MPIEIMAAMNLQAPVMRRTLGPMAGSQPLRAPRIVAQRQQQALVGREQTSFFGASSLKAFTQPPVLRPAKLSSRLLVEAAKKSVGDLGKQDLEGKVVFVRADLNVPLDGSTITDDTRVRAAIPTLKYLISNGAKVLLTSHLVCPYSQPVPHMLHGKACWSTNVYLPDSNSKKNTAICRQCRGGPRMDQRTNSG